jgi:hypothetical protein
MAREKTNEKNVLPESQQAGQGSLDDSAEKQQNGQGAAGKARQTASPADYAADFNRLRERANRGDRDAQARLIQHLDSHPAMWAELGEMAGLAERALAEAITDGEWLTTQAIKRQAAELRQQLSRPSQSPLEGLAVQRLVACWIQLQFVESMCVKAEGKFEGARFWLQRQQQAHKLYAAAEKSLLMVRGLVPASVQLSATTQVAVSTSISEANGAKPDEKVSEPAERESSVVAAGRSATFQRVNRMTGLTDALKLVPEEVCEEARDGIGRVNGSGMRRSNMCTT